MTKGEEGSSEGGAAPLDTTRKTQEHTRKPQADTQMSPGELKRAQGLGIQKATSGGTPGNPRIPQETLKKLVKLTNNTEKAPQTAQETREPQNPGGLSFGPGVKTPR